MTRKEAIRIIEANCSCSESKLREACAMFVPELRESEDERIRKAIIYNLSNLNIIYNATKEECLAWLEKQKEQKPAELTSGVRIEYDEDGVPIVKPEQKPAEWSDIDNIGWGEAFACVTRAEKAAKNEEELQNAVTAEKWLKEIKFKYCVHPVKQEWSEEDKAMIECLIRHVQEEFDKLCNDRYGHQEIISDLKESCRERINWLENRLKSLRPQKKEDEK